MNRRSFVAHSLLVAAAPAAAFAAGDDTFRVAVDALGNGIDPYRDIGSDIDRYAWAFGDGLTDGMATPGPALAMPPQPDAAGTTLRYVLREAFWHDGERVRSRDVVDALAALSASPAAWGSYAPYALVENIRVIDDARFDVRLHHASASFARTFFSPYGRPAIPLLRHGPGGEPIGTGPFRFVGRDGDRVRFVRFSGALRGDAASAALEFRLRPSPTTLGLELASGAVDLALPIIRHLPGADRYRIVSRPLGVIVVLFNCAETLNTAERRRAFLQAIDVGEIQRTIDPETSQRFTGILAAGAPNDVPFAFPARDLVRARAVLGGLPPLRIVYLAESVRYARLALLVEQMLRDAGVRAEIVPRPQASYQAPLGPLRSGRFDLAISGLPYTDDPDLAADWSCAKVPPHGGNFARYCNPAFDAAYTAGRTRDALRIVAADAPFFPLARSIESFGIAPGVDGFDAPAPWVPPTLSAARWRRRR